MIKSHIKKVIKDEEIIDEVICNCCGKLINKHNEHLTIDMLWGYDSNKENKRHQFDICEDCYDKFVASFKIPVEVKENLF